MDVLYRKEVDPGSMHRGGVAPRILCPTESVQILFLTWAVQGWVMCEHTQYICGVFLQIHLAKRLATP